MGWIWPTVATIISLLALVVSYFSFNKSTDNQNRLIEIEERREKDRKKALLVPRLMSQENKLYIDNITNNIAKNVKVFVDGHFILEHPGVLKSETYKPVVGAHSSIFYYMPIYGGCKAIWEVQITWINNNGEPGENASIVQI